MAIFRPFGPSEGFENVANRIFDPIYLLDDLKLPKSWVISVLWIFKFFKPQESLCVPIKKVFSKIEGPFAKFQPIFNRKTVLNSQRIGESSFDQSTELQTPYFFTIMSLYNYKTLLDYYLF